MLYPIVTQTRSILDLNGIWKFTIDKEVEKIDPAKPLKNAKNIAVPASFNDQLALQEIRQHSGFVWYQREVTIPNYMFNERLVLRFGSATHEAWVYINGKEVTHHKGGFTPFEVEINSFLKTGKNLLIVKLSNILDYTTLPVGNYSETVDANGKKVRKVDENFDFFNYAGLHRPIKIYSTPKSYIEDITIVPDVDLKNKSAKVNVEIATKGKFDVVKVTILDEEEKEVAQMTGTTVDCTIQNVHLWQPMQAYLYRAKVEGIVKGEVVDCYTEEFGIRKIEIAKGKFFINGEPFYFKGFGKHEDTYVNGRGLNEAYNVLDINLMKAIGANSFRTSHYPYSEEMMRLCDREGIVVIDETPAVGLMTAFNFDISALLSGGGKKENTWNTMHTHEAHMQVIRELIARDKNHACVCVWSIANEASNHEEGAYEYFAPLFALARELDKQKRPCTYVSIMSTMPNTDKTSSLTDIICLNRYYGWYLQHGDLLTAEKAAAAELKEWEKLYPDKPIMYTEYGADTVSGFHSMYGEPFTEEFQQDYYEMNSRVFDGCKNFVGEQLWNFADFQTKFGIFRVQGNKKGIFNRAREPKMVVRYLRKRWKSIPDLGFKK